MTVGETIKKHRKQNEMTLRELSDKTGLSAGYLSLVERNKTSLTLSSLQAIAEALNINPNIFLNARPTVTHDYVLHSDERQSFKIEGRDNVYYYSLAIHSPDGALHMGPMIEVLLPGEKREDVVLYAHDNEEFGYVLEGVLSLFVADREYQLYPGDCFHYYSTTPHYLANFTNKLVTILYVLSDKTSFYKDGNGQE